MILQHPYYQLTKGQQRNNQLKLGIAAFFINVTIGGFFLYLSWYFMAVLFLVITMTIIAPFFDVPSMVKKGRLIYHSPLLLTEKERKGVIIMHGGTLFDYYYVLPKNWNGRERTRFILKSYLEGLIHLIESYEDQPIEGLKLRGTSYILNERTALRIGFQKVSTDFFQLFILIFNYFNLLAANSLAKGQLRFPNLKSVHSFECSLTELMERKDYLIKLRNRL